MDPQETTIVVPRLLTGRQVLDLLGLSTKFPRQTLMGLRDRGLPAVFVRGKFVYKATDVVRFIQHRSGGRR